MKQEIIDRLRTVGYTLLFDIFPDWEHVKDELLLPGRKNGTGNGTVHVFLGAADSQIRKEFPSYYQAVESGADTADGAIKVKHYFDVANLTEGISTLSSYLRDKNTDATEAIQDILLNLSGCVDRSGFVTTESFLKLSTGSQNLRPYFKQFQSGGLFFRVVRELLFQDSRYKISFFKNEQGKYAALWELQFGKPSSNDVQFSKRKTDLPLQQISYGAPGTGKSHGIKVHTKGESVIRTTFHPDSDYSTFVGAYKPTMKSQKLEKENKHFTLDQLAYILKDEYFNATSGKSLAVDTFAYKYVDYLDGDFGKVSLQVLLDKAGLPPGYQVALRDSINFAKQHKDNEQETIAYEFVPQAFLQAYVKAWKFFAENNDEPQKQFLVIEEINRGNCAQIFGDIFQLLDRNDAGFSDYPIQADKDMRQHLAKAFAGVEGLPENIGTGEDLLLPPNLYIWATMNTSDQSLFPIDSAFKRRWDWKYVPIDTEKENWAIAVGGKKYSWTSFLNIINEEIFEKTTSEDKQLGFFFCKAKDGVISAERFVSKVLFFIYNDVYKDYGFDDDFFNDSEGGKLTFRKYYTSTGSINDKKVQQILDNLKIKEYANEEDDEKPEDEADTDASTKDRKESIVSVTYNGEKLTLEGRTQFDIYLETLQKIGIETVAPIIEGMKYRRLECPMVSKTKYEAIDNGRGYNYVQVGEYYIVKGAKYYTLIRILEDLKASLNLDLEIEYR